MTPAPTATAAILTAEARAARAALIFLAWHAAHGYADHIGQRPHDAEHKGDPGWPGRAACARHVAGLTATKAAALGVVLALTGVRLNPRAVAVAMAADALTHYTLDRRTPLAKLAQALGKDRFYRLGDPQAAPTGTGAYAMDQAAHGAALALAAVLAALGWPARQPAAALAHAVGDGLDALPCPPPDR